MLFRSRTPGGVLYSAGAAYVFTRAGAAWSESAILTAQTPVQYGYFGSGLAIAGGSAPTLVVGSERGTGAGGVLNTGVAYVFTATAGTWSQAAVLTSSAQVAYGGFGSAVALSADGTTAAIAAYAEDVETSPGTTIFGAGAIHVYTGAGSSWNHVARLSASNPMSYVGFGRTLAMSADGSTLATGATGEDGSAAGVNGTPDTNLPSAGAVYLFTETGSEEHTSELQSPI